MEQFKTTKSSGTQKRFSWDYKDILDQYYINLNSYPVLPIASILLENNRSRRYLYEYKFAL